MESKENKVTTYTENRPAGIGDNPSIYDDLPTSSGPFGSALVISNFFFKVLQVATALLVAGSTLTFWRPQFVCTSSYSSVVQSARLLV